MKKMIVFLLMLLAIPIALLAQEPTVPPTGWGDIFSNPALWLSSFAGVSLLTAFVATFINGFLKVTTKFLKQFVAWLVAIGILVLCDLFNIKICYSWDFPIWLAILHGFAAGLASNGWFDIPWLKTLLDKIAEWFPPKVPTP